MEFSEATGSRAGKKSGTKNFGRIYSRWALSLSSLFLFYERLS
jgi:hypothetical protein